MIEVHVKLICDDDGETIVPVEVKAKENLQAKSLRTYRTNLNQNFASELQCQISKRRMVIKSSVICN